MSLRHRGALSGRLRIQQRGWRAVVIVSALLLPALLMGGATLFGSAALTAVRDAYTRSIVDAGKEPAFLLTLAFVVTFGVVRLVTYSIRDHLLPFLHNVTTKSGLHIHHMVPGVLLILASGYLSLALPH